jgi:hypothetical protein
MTQKKGIHANVGTPYPCPSAVNSQKNGLRRTAGVTVHATHAARRRRRAAPTAFQRTSLLMKCNTTERKCKGLARRTRRVTRKGESGFFSFFRVFCVFCGKKVLLFGALAAREAASQQFVHSAWREHTQMSNTASGP